MSHTLPVTLTLPLTLWRGLRIAVYEAHTLTLTLDLRKWVPQHTILLKAREEASYSEEDSKYLRTVNIPENGVRDKKNQLNTYLKSI